MVKGSEAVFDLGNIFLESIPYPLWIIDLDSRILFLNSPCKKLFGIELKEVNGKKSYEVFRENQAQLYEEQKEKCLKGEECIILEEKLEGKLVESYIFPLKDEEDNIRAIAGIVRDITEQKRLEEKLRYLSEIDVVTGLYNRHSFENKIAELNKEEYMPLGIIMGDVNGLKIVNDTLGHLEGDKLIKAISEILYKACHQRGYAFRWGGDEFIMLLPKHNGAQCEEVIQLILKECSRYEFEFMQLSIALGEGVKETVEDDIYEQIKIVEEKVYRHKLLEKKSLCSSIIISLKKTLEEKNIETEEHTRRVAHYAKGMGQQLKLSISEMDELILVAQLHDVGMIGVNEEILHKKGNLTEEEYAIMKIHSERGYRIINASSQLGKVATCVLAHHERWDGKGYPLGLKGEEIPLLARIIHIIDAYDAMLQDRVYKKGVTQREAIDELKRCAGTQFDEAIVQEFIKYLESGQD